MRIRRRRIHDHDGGAINKGVYLCAHAVAEINDICCCNRHEAYGFRQGKYVLAIERQNVERGCEEAKPAHRVARQQELLQRLLFGWLQRGTRMLAPVFAQFGEGLGQNITIPVTCSRKIDDFYPAALEASDVWGPGIDEDGIRHPPRSTQAVANDMPNLAKVGVIML